MINLRKLESELWESADLLRAESKLTSQEYCMPVLGLIFLRYAYSRFRYVEAEIMKDRPVRNGRVLPVESIDFQQKSAIFLPEEARYEYLLNLEAGKVNIGEKVNHAMTLIETESPQLSGVLPKTYTSFKNELLWELLRIFNNSALNDIQDDIIGRIYEYFLNKFAPAVASDDGVFFTPKSLVRMIVNIIEPKRGIVLDPACGSGGMFVSSADFTEQYGANANMAMTFYGQEKVEYNSKLCLMNMAVHGLNAQIVSGDDANSFYHDHFGLEGKCDFVMANPPFNVDKVKDTPHNCAKTSRVIFGDPKFREKAQFKRMFAREINLVTQPSFDCEQGINSQVQTACSNADAIFPFLGIVSCRNERFSLSRKTHVSGDLTTSIVLSYSTFLSIDDIFKIIFYILTLNFSLPQKEHWRVASTQWPF